MGCYAGNVMSSGVEGSLKGEGLVVRICPAKSGPKNKCEIHFYVDPESLK